jgi:hypothetical protein
MVSGKTSFGFTVTSPGFDKVHGIKYNLPNVVFVLIFYFINKEKIT